MMKLKNVQVLDPAQKPIRPEDAKLPRNIGIGIFLGLLIGFGIGWLLEFFDRTIKTPEDIALNFKKPVMGTIPENEPNKGRDTDCAVDRSIGIVLFEKSRSHIAEAFRLLRTNIQYASPDNPPKIIMVSSAMPGEGKTSVVSNLALSLANSGKKVLVIDCDLRKPALHKMFKLGNIEGVVNFLVGDKKLDECIHKEIMERLDIMTCGPLPPNPSELLMSEVFANMLKELRELYDYVFIDAPPSLNMADAAIIGRASDGLLFVVNSGRTRIDFVKKSLEQLEQVNVNVLGLLLNRFSLKTAGYNYYNYYNYYYYYYHYGPEPTTRRSGGK
jgi:capsular exopolysaccharide synthesis family protein